MKQTVMFKLNSTTHVVNIGWKNVVFVANCQKIKKQWNITNTALVAINFFLNDLRLHSDERQILGDGTEADPHLTEYRAPG